MMHDVDLSDLGAVPASAHKSLAGVHDVDLSDLGGMAIQSHANDSSMLGAAGRGAAGMIPLGEQAIAGASTLGSHKTYAEERQALRDQIQKDIDQQPEARLAGQVAGVAAPIIATAGLAAPESLAGAAAQGALVGGAYGAGNAVDTLASGGSGTQAAGDVALGAGVGALGGAAGEGLSGALGKLAGFTAPSAEEFTAGNTARVLRGTTRQVRNLPGKNPVTTLNALGDTMRDATVNGQPLVNALDRTPDMLQKFIDLQKQAGETIGNTIKAAKVEPMDVNDLISKIKPTRSFMSPDDTAHLNGVIDSVKQYADEQGKLPFDRLQQLKTDIGDQAFQGQGNDVLKGVYHTINDVQDAELDKLGAQIQKPEFDLAKKHYQLTSRAIPMLKMGVGKELTNKASLTVPGAALVTGHPIAAGLAFAKPRLEQIANGLAFKAGNTLPGIAANVANKAATTGGALTAAAQTSSPTDLHLNHPAMAPWRKLFITDPAAPKQMADGGMVEQQEPLTPGEIEKHNTVTDFTLSQRDPAYAEAKQKAADNPQAENEPQKMAQGGMVTPSGFPEPQESDNPPAGAEVPFEQRLLNNASTAAVGYGMGNLGATVAQKGYSMTKGLGEAGAIFPKGPVDLGSGVKVSPKALDEYVQSVKAFNGASAKDLKNLDYARELAHDKAALEALDNGATDLTKTRHHIGRFVEDVLGQPVQRYGEGGVVSQNGDNSMLSQMRDKVMGFKGLPGFGSTLPGLENIVQQQQEPVRSATPDEPFNQAMEEQLLALMAPRKKPNAQ